MKTMHWVLVGKGGCSKTFVASLLAQYIQERTGKLICYDSDQNNPDFSAYKNLNVKHIQLTDENLVIRRELLDVLSIEADAHNNTNIVIDNGSNTFSAIRGYFAQTGVIDYWRETGWEVYIHSIICGGDFYMQTTQDFFRVSELGAKTVLWLNDYWTSSKSANAPGDVFDMPEFAKHSGNITGTIHIPRWPEDLYGADINRMNANRLTLDELMIDTRFNSMQRMRLRQVVMDVFKKLDQIDLKLGI